MSVTPGERGPGTIENRRLPGLLSGWSECALLGLMLGACHGLAETTLMGWYGVRVGLPDVGVILATYASLGALGGFLLWPPILVAGALLGARRALADPRVRRLWFAVVSLPAYVGAGIWVIAGAGWGPAGIAWPAALVLCALIVFVASVRRGLDPVGLLKGLLALCFLAAGATVDAMEGALVAPGKRLPLVLSLLLASALPLSLLLFSRHGERHPSRRRALPRSLAALAALVLVDLALWTKVWPAPWRWEVRERPYSAAPARPGAPDVLLLVVDTLRADHMDLFGYARRTMPFLTSFARREGAVAMKITANASSSLPSHGAIFTGMYPSSHGGHYPFLDDPDPPPYAYPMRDDVPTLAEWMARLGYRTAGISANFGVLSAYGLPRGFSYYDSTSGPQYLALRISWLKAFRIRSRSAEEVLLRRMVPASVASRTVAFNRTVPPDRRADEIVDRAAAWFEAHPGDPSFVFVNLFDAHVPYLPVAGLDQVFAPRSPDIDWIGYPGDTHGLLSGTSHLTPAEIDYLVGQYDAELVFVDRQIERLFERLAALGRYDDMLIIIVSDHGESFMEHGYIQHGTSLYESEISVPLLIKFPSAWDRPSPEPDPHMQHTDLFPTIMAILGEEPPPTVQGKAWGTGRGYAMAEEFCLFRQFERVRRELFAVKIGDWKFLRSSTGLEESFDLAQDPGERRDILGLRPGLEAQARGLLIERDAGLARRESHEGIDPSILERLRALGYVK